MFYIKQEYHKKKDHKQIYMHEKVHVIKKHAHNDNKNKIRKKCFVNLWEIRLLCILFFIFFNHFTYIFSI